MLFSYIYLYSTFCQASTKPRMSSMVNRIGAPHTSSPFSPPFFFYFIFHCRYCFTIFFFYYVDKKKSIFTTSIVTYHHLLNDIHISFNEIGLNAHVTNQRISYRLPTSSSTKRTRVSVCRGRCLCVLCRRDGEKEFVYICRTYRCLQLTPFAALLSFFYYYFQLLLFFRLMCWRWAGVLGARCMFVPVMCLLGFGWNCNMYRFAYASHIWVMLPIRLHLEIVIRMTFLF